MFKNWLRPNIIGKPWKANQFQINLKFKNWFRPNIIGKPAKLNLEFELNLCPVHFISCKVISACKFTSHSGENEGLTYRQGGGPAHKDCNIGWKMKCQGLIILHHFYISILLSIDVSITVKISLHVFIQWRSSISFRITLDISIDRPGVPKKVLWNPVLHNFVLKPFRIKHALVGESGNNYKWI